MESFPIKGGVPLRGTVEIRGCKTRRCPLMASTLLTDQPRVICCVPDLSDTRFTTQILQPLGADAKLEKGTLTVHAKRIKGCADHEPVRKMQGQQNLRRGQLVHHD